MMIRGMIKQAVPTEAGLAIDSAVAVTADEEHPESVSIWSGAGLAGLVRHRSDRVVGPGAKTGAHPGKNQLFEVVTMLSPPQNRATKRSFCLS